MALYNLRPGLLLITFRFQDAFLRVSWKCKPSVPYSVAHEASGALRNGTANAISSVSTPIYSNHYGREFIPHESELKGAYSRQLPDLLRPLRCGRSAWRGLVAWRREEAIPPVCNPHGGRRLISASVVVSGCARTTPLSSHYLIHVLVLRPAPQPPLRP